MSDTKLKELIAMSGRATQGEWRVSKGELSAPFPFGVEYLIATNYSDQQTLQFIAALVNWFRETYIKERA